MVSVCMATYNGAKYIKKQIESILCQLKEGDELIISDDGSTDATLEIVQSFDTPKIKFFPNQIEKRFKHGQYIANFENALIQASGDILFFADQDDIWLNDKIDKMIEGLNNCELVVSDCKIVDENLQTIYESYFQFNQSDFNLFKSFNRNPYLGCTMAFKSRLLDLALPFPNCISGHDLWLGILAEMYFKVGIINQPTILYRRHDLNVSNKANKIEPTIREKSTIAIEMLTAAMNVSIKNRNVR